MPDEQADVRQVIEKALAVATTGRDEAGGYAMSRLRLATLDELTMTLEGAKKLDLQHFDPDFACACIFVQVSEELKRRMEEVKSGTLTLTDAANPPRSGSSIPPSLRKRPPAP